MKEKEEEEKRGEGRRNDVGKQTCMQYLWEA